MAKKLEEHLYRSAHTKEEYIDPASLKRRLHLIAKGVGIPKPEEDSDSVEGQSRGGELGASNHSAKQQAVPIETVSQGPASAAGPIAISGNTNPSQQNGNQAQEAQHQLQILQQQEQSQQILNIQAQQDPQAHQPGNNAPSQQQLQQQSGNDGVSSIPGLPQDFAGPDPFAGNIVDGTNVSEKNKVILLQQQRRLLLLRHASKCDGGASCSTKFCPQMVTLWKHMKKCRDKHCKVSHCLSSRCVLNHYRICKNEGKTARCAICAPVMKHIRQSGDTGTMGTPLGPIGFGADDELDALALGAEGVDPLEGPQTEGVDAAQLPNIEPLDAFALGGDGTAPQLCDDGSGPLSPNPMANALSQATLGGGGSQPQNNMAPLQPQVAAAMGGGMGQSSGQIMMGVPQSQQGGQGIAPTQGLRLEIQKKQVLLQQVHQQQANLSGQRQKLQQQLVATSNPQQAQQLQNQQMILQQLKDQFEHQQSILQSEIQRHSMALQRQEQQQQQQQQQQHELSNQHQLPMSGSAPPSGSGGAQALVSTNLGSQTGQEKSVPGPTPTLPQQVFAGAASAKALKRSSGDVSVSGGHAPDDASRPQKKSKVENSDTSGQKDTGTSQKSLQENLAERGTVGISDTHAGAAKKGEAAPTSEKGASPLIPSMHTQAIEQHFDSLVNTCQLTPRHIARKCLPLVKKLINHEHGWVFKDAVDPFELGIPEYFNIVDHPMDLTLVANKLEDGVYKDVGAFERDTKLVFENAILFNGEDSDVGAMAKELLDIFDADLKNATKGLKIDKENQKKRGNTCSLCGNFRRLLDPPALFCSGSCGMNKIRRNAIYYTDRFKQNHWCERCYSQLKDTEPVQLDDGRETKKSLLLQMKNDSTPEEPWVQCDLCHDWNHQTCSLFNSSQHPKSAKYTCPKCHLKERSNAPGGASLSLGVYKDASHLPHCNLSRAIEDGLSKTLSKAYDKVAEDRGCYLSQVERAEGLCVRVVSSLQKKHKVREEMAARYAKKGYPSEYTVTTKCIVLFQKVHGADVLLFGMYVYEYGDECPGPNRRRVYISYLDSVQYLEPASYRTVVYHSIIVEYLRFVKLRGFHTAHIWSCPPAKGDEYIFHCHPSHQLTPSDDMLCAWYVDMLNKAKAEGIVLETRTIFDEYLKDNAVNPDTGEPYDPTSIPYFDGDWIPGEIEKIIKELKLEESKREDTRINGSSLTGKSTQKKQEGKRVGTRSNPGELVNQARDKVMNRLFLVLSRMKNNFMVAQLLSDDFIHAVGKGRNVSSWRENSVKKSKGRGKNPIHDLDRPVSRLDSSDAISSLSWNIVGDTKDHDALIEQECIDTRLQFLNFCQRSHYQFDSLRRAKYTTMMLLAHLHKPRTEHEQQIKAHLQVVTHAATCVGPPSCLSTNCRRMKQFFQHIQKCDVTYKRGCVTCTRLFMLLTRHSRDCTDELCPIPFCGRIKERTRQLLKQQQMMDDRRRNAQNDRLRSDE
ncbi:hypothetical protein ACHAWF_012686 [Thalassiosira exigua]